MYSYTVYNGDQTLKKRDVVISIIIKFYYHHKMWRLWTKIDKDFPD